MSLIVCQSMGRSKHTYSLKRRTLEERMGCGLVVCLGCAVEVTGGGYEHVCKQGPVFDSKKVII